jgi:hypothetical protein
MREGIWHSKNVNKYCACVPGLYIGEDPFCWLCSKLRKPKEVIVQNYIVLNTIEGNLIEAIKLLAEDRVTGNIAGKEVNGIPILHLTNGKSIMIGDDYVTLLKKEEQNGKTNNL